MYNGLGIYKEQQLDMPLNSNGDQERGKEPGYRFRKTRASTIITAVTVLLLSGLIATTAALAVRTTRLCLDCADIPSCPDGWVGYRRQCYFFSEDERNWTASQSYCSSHDASLAGIDSGLEMTFLLRYKGSVYHWIGLRREPRQSWKWPNGTEFDNRFEVRGGGDCAYLNDIGVSSSNCETEKNWICARPDQYGKRKENSLGPLPTTVRTMPPNPAQRRLVSTVLKQPTSVAGSSPHHEFQREREAGVGKEQCMRTRSRSSESTIGGRPSLSSIPISCKLAHSSANEAAPIYISWDPAPDALNSGTKDAT